MASNLCEMHQTLQQVCQAFLGTVIATYTWYLDSFRGLELMREDMERRQKEAGFDDDAFVPYLRHDEGNPNLTGLVQTTAGEFKKRNSVDGPNFEFLGNMFVVALFSWWDDHHRARIANYLNRDKRGVSIPIMGDIRWLRNGIVHANGIATKEIKKCEIIDWFQPGERIVIDFDRAEFLGMEIKKGVETFYRNSLIIQ